MGLEILFDRFGAKLYHMGYAYLKSKEDAEEIVQDVLLKLWQNRGKIDKSGYLEGYIFKINKNLLLNCMRSKARKGLLTKELTIDTASTASADHALLLDDMQEFFSKAIQGMPSKRQRVFKMSRIEGFSNRKIAQKLGLSERTVENQISRAIKYLRTYMTYTSILLPAIVRW